MTAGFRILPMPARPARELVAALAGMVTPHLSDNMSRLQGAAAAIRPMHGGGAKLAGPAFTVRVPAGDNLMVHKAIDIAEPGEVIVVDAGGDLTNAIIGEIMLTHAQKRGVAGFVIDGAIRDSDAIAKSAFPVFARGVTHRGPYKDGPGEINVTAVIGGQAIQPGDIVLGDADGMLAVPRGEALAIAKGARAQVEREARTLAAIADGTIDRSWVDEALRAKGMKA